MTTATEKTTVKSRSRRRLPSQLMVPVAALGVPHGRRVSRGHYQMYDNRGRKIELHRRDDLRGWLIKIGKKTLGPVDSYATAKQVAFMRSQDDGKKAA